MISAVSAVQPTVDTVVGYCSLEPLLRLRYEIEGIWIWEYNKEDTGLLDAPYQLAYRLQLCIVIFPNRESQVQSC
jgi:hypothetical protein